RPRIPAHPAAPRRGDGTPVMTHQVSGTSSRSSGRFVGDLTSCGDGDDLRPEDVLYPAPECLRHPEREGERGIEAALSHAAGTARLARADQRPPSCEIAMG